MQCGELLADDHPIYLHTYIYMYTYGFWIILGSNHCKKKDMTKPIRIYSSGFLSSPNGCFEKPCNKVDVPYLGFNLAVKMEEAFWYNFCLQNQPHGHIENS